MSKPIFIGGRNPERVYVDCVECNASQALRQAISTATGASMDTHMLLDRSTLGLLQGIEGVAPEDLKREAKTLAHQVQTNGIVILCPNSK